MTTRLAQAGRLPTGLLWLTLVALLAGCPSRPGSGPLLPSAGGAPRPVVAVSLPPLADWVHQVAGDAVQVVTLLPPGASPHTFEPTPRLAEQASAAALVVVIGLGLDLWAERLAAPSGARVLRLGPLVPTLPLAPEQGPTGGAGQADEHEEGHADPHVFVDPVRAATMVAALTEALVPLVPDSAPEMRRRSQAYQQELQALAQELEARLRPYRGRRLTTMHGGFNYFLARCGLPPALVLTPYPGQEPSARYLEWLIQTLRALEVQVVAAEPQFSPRAAETLAAETGARLITLDYLGNPQDPARDTYVKLLRWDAEQLVKGLSAAGGLPQG